MAFSLSQLNDHVKLNIGTFIKGRWDYIGLAQRYPEYEAIAQLAPRKQPASNYEQTVTYQTDEDVEPQPTKPGSPVQPSQTKKALTRKIKLVKVLDSIGWTLDSDKLKGKSDEHIVKQIQMDMVGYDLRWWLFLEHALLRKATNIIPDDDEHAFGFPAWVTDGTVTDASGFQLYGGADPYAGGRPGGITVAAQPKFTNPVAEFASVSDDDFFDKIETFLTYVKVMGIVPNPRLIPDTPSRVCYVNDKVLRAVQRYMQASNQDTGLDAGRYRGKPSYKGIPFTTLFAAFHPDSPVKDATCVVRLIDWNTFEYGVHPDYDRLTEGPKDADKVPGEVYMTTQHWHQIACQRPDRSLFMESATPSLQP